jgi:hypothetical protein
MELTFKIDLSDLASAQQTIDEVQDLVAYYKAKSVPGTSSSSTSSPRAGRASMAAKVPRRRSAKASTSTALNLGTKAKFLFQQIEAMIDKKGEATLDEIAFSSGLSVKTVRACLMNGMRSVKFHGGKLPFIGRWNVDRNCVVYTHA